MINMIIELHACCDFFETLPRPASALMVPAATGVQRTPALWSTSARSILFDSPLLRRTRTCVPERCRPRSLRSKRRISNVIYENNASLDDQLFKA